MGSADKTIRFLIAIVLIVLWLTDTLTGPMAYVAISIAVIFALTSYISFCPLYTIFKIRTNKSDNK